MRRGILLFFCALCFSGYGGAELAGWVAGDTPLWHGAACLVCALIIVLCSVWEFDKAWRRAQR